jgi:DNA-directed RNA polymerase specialized sigma24 family protein
MEVSDAVQEIFLEKFVTGNAICRFLDRSSDMAGFEPHVYVVVRNATRDMNDAWLTRASRLETEPVETAESCDPLTEPDFRRVTYKKGTPSPETAALRDDVRRMVRVCLQTLLEQGLSGLLALVRSEDSARFVRDAETLYRLKGEAIRGTALGRLVALLLRGQDDVTKVPTETHILKQVNAAFREQDVIRLTYFLGFKAAETASRLGISAENVWIILSRARKELMRIMKVQYGIGSREDLARLYDVRF